LPGSIHTNPTALQRIPRGGVTCARERSFDARAGLRQNISVLNDAQHDAPSRATPLSGQDEWGGHTTNGIRWRVFRGDAAKVLATLDENRYKCVITSPPYFWQRDYGVEGQIGKESRIETYVAAITGVMNKLKRVLAVDGLLLLNLGDTYYSAKGQPKGTDRKNGARRFGLRAVDASGLGVPRKTAIGIPWRVAIQMISDGWTLRCPIIWQRNGSIPEPTAHDRPWRTYETVFMFSKTPRYYFDRSAVKGVEDIWNISSRAKGTNGVHSAPFPDQLVDRCLSAGCPPNGEVLDPFAGGGTVLRVALRKGHPVVGIDLSDTFCRYMAEHLGKF
jgi:DNA modification methylase